MFGPYPTSSMNRIYCDHVSNQFQFQPLFASEKERKADWFHTDVVKIENGVAVDYWWITENGIVVNTSCAKRPFGEGSCRTPFFHLHRNPKSRFVYSSTIRMATVNCYQTPGDERNTTQCFVATENQDIVPVRTESTWNGENMFDFSDVTDLESEGFPVGTFTLPQCPWKYEEC
jgi:hypothetical protein